MLRLTVVGSNCRAEINRGYQLELKSFLIDSLNNTRKAISYKRFIRTCKLVINSQSAQCKCTVIAKFYHMSGIAEFRISVY
jgi:hypothetical protein